MEIHLPAPANIRYGSGAVHVRVVIVGAGQVGSSIAASLEGDHEVVVVDNDAERVNDLTYSLDVLTIEGDGASLSTLREAGIEAADLLIASTDDDETKSWPAPRRRPRAMRSRSRG